MLFVRVTLMCAKLLRATPRVDSCSRLDYVSAFVLKRCVSWYVREFVVNASCVIVCFVVYTRECVYSVCRTCHMLSCVSCFLDVSYVVVHVVLRVNSENWCGADE